jgi:hypothetical protein
MAVGGLALPKAQRKLSENLRIRHAGVAIAHLLAARVRELGGFLPGRALLFKRCCGARTRLRGSVIPAII